MKIRYDDEVDALYIRFVDEPAQCRVVRLTDQVAVNFGPGEKVVGIEVLDASQFLGRSKQGKIKLENLAAVG